MSIDYGEIVCTAIDEIVTAKLQGLQYDITKLCTVIDDTYSYQGRYTVSDGTARYEAFSNNTSFKNGNNVLVVIPNGDYTLQKTITGRVAAADTTPFNYTSPMDTMIRITNNIFDNSNTIYGNNAGLVANADGKASGTIVGPLYSLTESADFAGFTRLGITADLRSWLTGLDVVSGTYGLKILIYTEVPSAPGKTNDNAVYELTFSSADMIGNPYQFESYFSQEKVFDISNITNIKQIDVYFYQNGQFKDGQKNLIPWYDEDNILGVYNKPNNLFVDNVKIYLGYEKGAFTEDTLMLYTNDSMSYHYSHEDLWKDISLRWIHKVGDNDFTLLNSIDIDGNNYEVHWFRYHPGWETIDQYAGKDWEEITSAKNQMQCSFLPDIKKRSEQIKVIGLIKETQENDKNKSVETITPYYSNLFIFENEEYVPDDITVNAATALTIVCMDRTEGNYYLYNQNGKINNEGLGQGYKRYFKAMYQGAEITSSLGKLDWIKWLVPENSTMLIVTDEYIAEKEGSSSNAIVRYKGVNYKEITRKIHNDTKELYSTQQAFSVANIWNQQESNNTVMCQVSINGVIYEAIAELRFGKSGTNGTTTTFLIEFTNNQNALIINNNTDEKNTVTVGARLYDSDNSRIDFTTNELENIKWSWFKYTTDSDGEDKKYISIPNSANGKQFIDLTCNINNIPEDNYYILQAEYNDLVAYLPIPLKTADTDFIEGAREIIYNHQGIPNYYTGPYVLYYTQDGEYQEGASGTWNIKWDELIQSAKKDDVTEKGYIPSLKSSSARPGYKALSASPFYASGKNDKVCVYYKDEKNNKYGWSQPILIMQSKYDFAMLNEWDGSLTIDENNGKILSTMLGAGRKNDDNTFSGVLIGDIEGGTGLKDSSFFVKVNDSEVDYAKNKYYYLNNGIYTLDSSDTRTEKREYYIRQSLTGVYGLHEGVMSYALKEDGTATFGKSGHGQIKINGNSGIIQSSSYNQGSGMKIDLDDGIIDILGNNGSQIQINSIINEDRPSYFTIKSDKIIDERGKRQTLIDISDGDYFIQSNNYTENGSEGSLFNLTNGSLNIKNKQSKFSLNNDENNWSFNISVPALNNKKPGTTLNNAGYSEKILSIDSNDYYLKSANYSGAKLAQVKINGVDYNSYNGGSVGANNDGSKIYVLSKEEGWQEKSFSNKSYYKYDENGNITENIAFTITEDQYRSNYLSQLIPDYETNGQGSGMNINLAKGTISGYDLQLKGINADDSTKIISIDSSNKSTPLRIGKNFSVGWDGNLTCSKLTSLNNDNRSNYAVSVGNNFYITEGGNAGGSGANFKGTFGGSFGGSFSGNGNFDSIKLNGTALTIKKKKVVTDVQIGYSSKVINFSGLGFTGEYTGETGPGGEDNHKHSINFTITCRNKNVTTAYDGLKVNYNYATISYLGTADASSGGDIVDE